MGNVLEQKGQPICIVDIQGNHNSHYEAATRQAVGVENYEVTMRKATGGRAVR